MAKARNVKFGVQNDYKQFYQKSKIKEQRERGLGNVTCFQISGPLYISVTAKARNLKFGVQNDHKFYQKNAKLRDKGGVA